MGILSGHRVHPRATLRGDWAKDIDPSRRAPFSLPPRGGIRAARAARDDKSKGGGVARASRPAPPPRSLGFPFDFAQGGWRTQAPSLLRTVIPSAAGWTAAPSARRSRGTPPALAPAQTTAGIPPRSSENSPGRPPRFHRTRGPSTRGALRRSRRAPLAQDDKSLWIRVLPRRCAAKSTGESPGPHGGAVRALRMTGIRAAPATLQPWLSVILSE